MKFFTVIIFVVLPYFTLLSQIRTQHVDKGESSLFIQSSFDATKEKKNKIYFNNDWSFGNIITKDSALITNLSFRYDVKNDRFEIRSYLNPSGINKITLKGKYFIFSEFIKSGYKKAGYFELLNEGEIKLLIRRKTHTTPGKAGAYGYASRPNIVKAMFIKVGDKPAVEFDKKTDDILNFIPDKKNEIAEYITSNRINLKKIKNLIKVLNYYKRLTI